MIRIQPTSPTALATALLLSVAVAVADLHGQTWLRMSQSGPSNRSTHAMAYDAANGQVVLFGGQVSGSPGWIGDTWLWDGTQWLLAALASSPSSRYGHAMCYDSARAVTMLFGGVDGFIFPVNLRSDSWQWNGTNWSQIVSANNPPARRAHAMAFDSVRGTTVLFGGNVQSGSADDTWEFDGVDWQQRLPTHSAWSRHGHAMVFDPSRGKVVLFGGTSITGYRSDTWEWDGIDWLQRSPTTQPSARSGPEMVYDEAAGVVVMFGGINATGQLNDTWRWNGVTWSQATPASSPAPRSSFAMAYDGAHQVAVVFGGYDGGRLGDTWVYTNDLQASANVYGSGCGVPPLNFVPAPNARPKLGSTAAATISNAPTTLAFVAIGWSNTVAATTPLPLDLTSLGMPGCTQEHSGEVFGLLATPTTATSLIFQTPIPQQPSLLGEHVYLQSFALAPGANPRQVISSNGIDWLLGNL